MSKATKIAITGASGMVGYYVARNLVHNGYYNLVLLLRPGARNQHLKNFHSIELDFEDHDSLSNSLKDVNTVIHCAASLFGTKDELKKGNQLLTEKIVNAALDQNVKRMIYMSSVACLDRWRKERTKEENIMQDRARATEYAYSKYLSELEVHRGIAEGLNAVILYPSQILGLFYSDNPNTQLWKRIADQKYFYPIGSTGVVDVRDVAEAVKQILVRNIPSGQFILNAENVSFEQLFNSFREKINKNVLSHPLPAWLHRYGSLFFSIYYLFKLRLSHPYSNKYLRQLAFNFSFDNSRSRSQLNLDYRTLKKTLDDLALIIQRQGKWSDQQFLQL